MNARAHIVALAAALGSVGRGAAAIATVGRGAAAIATVRLALACTANVGGEWVAASGDVEAALSSVGPDGATYSLPSTATLTLQGPTSATVPLAPSHATQSFSLPAGMYTATLSQGVPDAGATWTLTRTADGGAATVQAVLTDAMPVGFTIAKGQTTSLVFHFAIESLGDVTFGTGTADAGIQVDAGAFPLTSGKVSGTATMSVETLNGPSAFNSALKFTGTAKVPYAVSLTRTGNWSASADRACAPVSATASSTAQNAGLAALVDEVSGGSGNICFGDANLAGRFTLQLHRKGTPTTTTMKSVLPAGGTFELLLDGVAPTVFSGSTLSLSKLAEPFTVSSLGVSQVVSSGGTVLADVASAPDGTASVTLQP